MKSTVDAPMNAVTPLPDSGTSVHDEIEDLIYIISHDLRASLRALIEVPQWIEDDLVEMGVALPQNLSSSLSLMNTNAARLDRMLIDLLVFSRVGRMQEVAPVSLDNVITQVLENLSLPKDFQVIHQFEWTSISYGQRDIVTLISALVSNAIKHHSGPHGTIVIETTTEGTTPVLFLSDDGPGIASKFEKVVFDFMQTLRPREEVEGSGMGLTIARKIAKHYGGSLTIDAPRLGAGVTFKICFADI